MSNRITLEMLRRMPMNLATTVPLDQLQMLINEIDEVEHQAKADRGLVQSVLDYRFGDECKKLRLIKGQDTGTVTIDAGVFRVKSDINKRVDWDQDELARVEKTLSDMGEDPLEYIKIERKVSESAFNNWPGSLAKMFEPARTVSGGMPKYKIEAKKGGR